jgi:hypothetical protein
MNRRGFLTGALGFLAAPAIVRASSLMPVSVQPFMVEMPRLIFSYTEPRHMWISFGGVTAFDDWSEEAFIDMKQRLAAFAA